MQGQVLTSERMSSTSESRLSSSLTLRTFESWLLSINDGLGEIRNFVPSSVVVGKADVRLARLWTSFLMGSCSRERLKCA